MKSNKKIRFKGYRRHMSKREQRAAWRREIATMYIRKRHEGAPMRSPQYYYEEHRKLQAQLGRDEFGVDLKPVRAGKVRGKARRQRRLEAVRAMLVEDMFTHYQCVKQLTYMTTGSTEDKNTRADFDECLTIKHGTLVWAAGTCFIDEALEDRNMTPRRYLERSVDAARYVGHFGSGVADSVEQLFRRFPALKNAPVVVCYRHLEKKDGGKDWDDLGPYRGEQKRQSSCLSEEPGFEAGVIIFDILVVRAWPKIDDSRSKANVARLFECIADMRRAGQIKHEWPPHEEQAGKAS